MSPSAGSFRDQHSGVTFDGDRVLRRFSAEGAEWFLAIERSGLLAELVRDGLLIDYEVLSRDPLVVSSPRVAIVSYPYEWTAEMLRDAARLTLDIASRAWDAGFHLRDASAFNVVFSGGRPVFVDLGSFRSGHTPFFYAFDQFTQHFLFPLGLASTTGVSPRIAWQSLDGLTADSMRRLGRGRLFRPSLIRHVWAPVRLAAGSPDLAASERRALRQDYGLPEETIRKSFDQLRSTLDQLKIDPSGMWADYENVNSYAAEETDSKLSLVAAIAKRRAGTLAVDVGANMGQFSAVLAPHYQSVVALEPDEAAADGLYRRVRSGELPSNITPVVGDIADPTPGRGVLNRERLGLLERLGGADLVVWLAVIHHLVIGRNIPLDLVFQIADTLGPCHLFEHVAPEDPMAELLLATREESPWPLDRATFEKAAADRFVIHAVDAVTDTRTVYELERR